MLTYNSYVGFETLPSTISSKRKRLNSSNSADCDKDPTPIRSAIVPPVDQNKKRIPDL